MGNLETALDAMRRSNGVLCDVVMSGHTEDLCLSELESCRDILEESIADIELLGLEPEEGVRSLGAELDELRATVDEVRDILDLDWSVRNSDIGRRLRDYLMEAEAGEI